MRGGLAETWVMAWAKPARTAETPKQPSLCLMLRAPYFYPTNQAANREDKPHPNVWGVPSLLEQRTKIVMRLHEVLKSTLLGGANRRYFQ